MTYYRYGFKVVDVQVVFKGSGGDVDRLAVKLARVIGMRMLSLVTL